MEKGNSRRVQMCISKKIEEKDDDCSNFNVVLNRQNYR